jgi:hypothetical protein
MYLGRLKAKQGVFGVVVVKLPTETSGLIPVPIRGRVARAEKNNITDAFERIVILPKSWKTAWPNGAVLRSVC